MVNLTTRLSRYIAFLCLVFSVSMLVSCNDRTETPLPTAISTPDEVVPYPISTPTVEIPTQSILSATPIDVYPDEDIKLEEGSCTITAERDVTVYMRPSKDAAEFGSMSAAITSLNRFCESASSMEIDAKRSKESDTDILVHGALRSIFFP